MPKSLIEQLPEIVKEGRRQAEKILEGLESRHRVSLQTREVVLPARDSKAQDWITQQRRSAQREVFAPGQASLLDTPQLALAPTAAEPAQPAWANRLIYGDNLLAMAALLAGDEHTPSLRGKVDLIYIDPPFDSKADYRTKVSLPGVELEQKPTVIEQFAYSDTWSDGTASYLAMITPRLILMRELLADTGSIYVHLDWHVGHYVKLVMDEVFGKGNFRNEVVWDYSFRMMDLPGFFNRKHDVIYFYSKGPTPFFSMPKTAWTREDLMASRKQAIHVDDAGVEWIWMPGGKGNSKNKMRRVDEILSEGKAISDVWDIPIISSSSKERVDYATQKPEALLERILEASCPEGASL